MIFYVLMPFQITIPIQVPSSPSANLHQHVRIHQKLLRLLELHRPSHAFHQNFDGRECEEKMQQSTSRAFYCGLGYLQYMSVARTRIITPNKKQAIQSILEAPARMFRPQRSQSPQISNAMPVNSMPGFWAISSFPISTKGTEAAGLDFG